MVRLLTNIESKDSSDVFHDIGQMLLAPWAIVCGRSFRIEEELKKLPDTSIVKKIVVVAIAIIFWKAAVVLTGIGILLLLSSDTHKKDYARIKENLNHLIIGNDSFVKAKDTVDDYDKEELKKVADILVNNMYYRNLIDKKVYDLKTKDSSGDTVKKTIYPELPNDLEEYEEKVPAIVSSVREVVEVKLQKAVRICNLLTELEKNHKSIFPYVI